MEIYVETEQEDGLSEQEIREALEQSLTGRLLKKVLIIPPDFTRFSSNAGFITNVCYHLLSERGARVDILPAIGTHEPMTREQFLRMFGDIPFENMIVHHWRCDVETVGEVPGTFLGEVTGGLWQEPLKAEVNRLLLHGGYDLILSVGQVVPHEVAGMSNHAKNIFVGVGGSDMINKSHMVGAVYGLERIMGHDRTPVRRVFDYALEHYMCGCPLLFVMTVTSVQHERIRTHGLFIGEKRAAFEHAVALAQKKNINFADRAIPKCVVWLDPDECRSTWLGNKAVYRTRTAMADGGELIVLAPGVSKFGEDAVNDALIRKYGYCGRQNILDLYQEQEDLRENAGVAAHLIHGSSDGRFSITYAVKNISRGEIEKVGYQSADYDELSKRYDPGKLQDGWNRLPDGEEIFFVSNPGLGLWIDRERFLALEDSENDI